MPFAYRFAGVAIRSNVAVTGLLPDTIAAEGNVDPLAIVQQSCPPPLPDRILATLSGRYETRFGTAGDTWLIDSKFDGTFLIDPTLRTLRLYSETSPPSAVCCDILVRRVLPRLMSARGAVTVHAASLATRGGGVVLFGNSGAGKSTTTAALSAMPGWDMLSDDLSTLWPGSPATVAPSGTGVCVWQASRDGLALDPGRCEPMPAYDGKFRFHPPGPGSTKAVPVRAFVFLARDAALDAPRVTPVSRIEGMALAARQMVLFDPSAPVSQEHAGALARLFAIASSAKMVRLSYPSRFDALPAVADVLAELADG